MNNNFVTFASIMFFYVVLSYVIFPLGFYYFINKTLISAGYGFVVGSIISVFLWVMVGQKMIK